MIYVSSTCSRKQKISEAVVELADNGFSNIELSGGSRYYDGYERDLLRLRDRYHINYLVHNYFPPPPTDFVVNLASTNDYIYKMSLDHLCSAIDFCRRMSIDRLGFHAGFFIDLDVSMLGRIITDQRINDREKCIRRFQDGVLELIHYANGEVSLYVENNVYSRANRKCFGQDTLPLMGLSFQELDDIGTVTGCNILFDVGHLFVTSKSLGLDFAREMQCFMKETDYLHVSDNDGLCDQNRGLSPGGKIFFQLQQYQLQDKIITLEIYTGYDSVHKSIEMLSALM